MLIHPDRLFPAEPGTRKIARILYEHVRTLPLISPHGHTNAAWFARNESFPDPAKLFVNPATKFFRILYIKGSSREYPDMRRPRGAKVPENTGPTFPSIHISF